MKSSKSYLENFVQKNYRKESKYHHCMKTSLQCDVSSKYIWAQWDGEKRADTSIEGAFRFLWGTKQTHPSRED